MKPCIKSLVAAALFAAGGAGADPDAARDQARERIGDEGNQLTVAAQPAAMAARKMPEEVFVDQPVKVEGGPRVFRTAHFEFATDQKVSKAFISRAAQVFESTYRAIAALPMGIEPSPPEGMERFKARFMKRETFDNELAGRIEATPGMKIAGAYIAGDREILVPYASIEAVRRGRKMTLRKSSDTTTLIHEITHQVMHDWLPFLPPWMFEGMAEYLAAVPYRNGRHEFRKAARGLKERLREIYQTDTPLIQNPGALLEGAGQPWSNSAQHYLTGMIMVYYFVHLDRGGQGKTLSAYFSLLRQAREETDRFIRDYNDALEEFEKQSTEYRKAFDIYRAKFAAYRTAVEERNRLVEQYNAQLSSDVPSEERVGVPDDPDPPEAPTAPAVPGILEKMPSGGGPIDVAAIAAAKAHPSLLRGRDGDRVASDMIGAYARIGIQLEVMPR